jgi:hypothetical protein
MINKIVEYKNEDSKIEIVPLFKNWGEKISRKKGL